MIGVIGNMFAIIIGGSIGLLFKKGIPEKISEAVMTGLGFCAVYVGISGMLKGGNTLILIISITIGIIIGTALDIDTKINSCGDYIAKKLNRFQSNSFSIAEGFVTATLLFCIGPLSIVGSLKAGLSGDTSMLFTQAVLNLITSVMLAASLGIGIVLSFISVLVIMGNIVLLAQYLQPILTTTVITEISCVGSLMIIAIGLNVIGITKIKVANYLPAILIVPILCWISSFLPAI